MEFEIQTESADLVNIQEYSGVIQMSINDPDGGIIVTYMSVGQARQIARELAAVSDEIEEAP